MTESPCPDPLTQIVTLPQLAARLGIAPATLRGHLSAGTPWVPRPDGRINGGAVWRLDSLEGIEEERRKPGRPSRPAPAAAPRPTVTAPGHDAPAETEPAGHGQANRPAPTVPEADGWWSES